MRTSADNRVVSEARIVPTRLRPRGAQFVESQEYISSPLTKYMATMDTQTFLTQVDTLIAEVEEYFNNLHKDMTWCTTYKSIIGSYQEQVKALLASDPENKDFQTLNSSLRGRKENLDERVAYLNRKKLGTCLETDPIDSLLSLDLEKKLCYQTLKE